MNTTNEQELRELAHIIMNADTPYDAMQFVKDHTNAKVREALNRLDKEIDEYVSTKPGQYRGIKSAIQAERTRLRGDDE